MSRRKIVLLFVGFLAMLLGTTYVVLQETGASEAFVRSTLSRFIRSDFDLKKAFIDLASGTITLEGFQLSRPGGSQDPIFEVERINVGVITNPLGDVLALEELEFEELTMHLDLGKGLPDVEELLELPADTQPASGDGSPAVYPPVLITDSAVQLSISPTLDPILFTDVNLQLVPENPDSSRMTLSGWMSTSAGFDLAVRGTADPAKGEFRAVVQATNIPLRPELARLVGSDLESELRAMGVDGNIDLLSLWIEYPSPSIDDDEEQVLRGGVTAEVSDLDITLPMFPYPVRGGTAKLSASTRDGGSLKFDLKSQSASGDVSAVGALTNYEGDHLLVDLRVLGQDLLVGVDLREAIARQPVADSVWTAFDPRAGRVDVDVHLANTVDDPVVRLEMDLDLAGVDMTFVGFPAKPGRRRLAFPLPLENAVGRVRLRRGLLTLERLEANVADQAGGGQMTIDGFLVTEDSGGDLKATLDIAGTGVQFSPQMRDAVEILVDKGAAIFDEYGPQGSANVKVRIRPDVNSDSSTYQVQILPLGASASFRGFPYRVDGIEGLVRIEPGGVSFELSGGDGGTSVDLRGRFIRGAEPDELRSELWVEAEDILANEKLRTALAALSPELENLWEYLSPGGLADCELSLWKSLEDEKPSFDLRIDVKEGTAELANFPIKLEQMHGSLFVHGTPEGRRTDVDTMRGTIDNGHGLERASFLLIGQVLRGDAENLDLTAVVRNLHLNRKLAVALDDNGAFRLSTWDILKPSGSVDVVLRQHQVEGADKPDQYLSVWLKDVRSDAAMLPQPATHISGEVKIYNGEAYFGASSDPRLPGENFGILTGRMGSAEIRCLEGNVKRDNGETKVMLTVASDEFPVDRNLSKLMKGPLQKAYLDRNMQGLMAVPSLTLSFTFPEKAENFTTRINGEVRARGVSMKLGTRIEGINGSLRVDEAFIGPGEGHVNGHLHNMSFRIVGHECHGFQATYSADANRLQIGLPSEEAPDGVPDLTLNLHGGTIEGRRGTKTALQYEYRDGGVLTLDTSFNGLSLSEFLRASGFRGNPFRGTLSGTLQLEELIGADFVNMLANGRVRITDADLGAVPAFTSIYAYMAPARRPRFDGAFIDFEVGNRAMTIKSIEVGSPLLDVSGDGVMTMDGYLDMNLWVPNLLGDDADWLVLPQLIQEFTSRVMQFDVYGYLRNTRVQPRWPWAATPPRERILPIPAPRRGKTPQLPF